MAVATRRDRPFRSVGGYLAYRAVARPAPPPVTPGARKDSATLSHAAGTRRTRAVNGAWRQTLRLAAAGKIDPVQPLAQPRTGIARGQSTVAGRGGRRASATGPGPAAHRATGLAGGKPHGTLGQTRGDAARGLFRSVDPIRIGPKGRGSRPFCAPGRKPSVACTLVPPSARLCGLRFRRGRRAHRFQAFRSHRSMTLSSRAGIMPARTFPDADDR